MKDFPGDLNFQLLTDLTLKWMNLPKAWNVLHIMGFRLRKNEVIIFIR